MEIVFCSTKGGVGKTTACCVTAAAFAASGVAYAVVDLDPQGSTLISLRLCGIQPPPPSPGAITLCDTPPRFDDKLVARIKRADLCVVVATPSPCDAAALAVTLKVLNGAKRMILLYNRIQANSSLSKVVLSGDKIKALSGPGFPNYVISKNPIRQSVNYQKFFANGWGALSSDDKQAAMQLATEILFMTTENKGR